jgi:hypothetical protein
METKIAELEGALRRWRIVSVAALVMAAFSILWTAVRVLTEPEAPIHADASDDFQQPGLRRRFPGMRRPGANGQRRRRPNAQQPGGAGQANPANEPDDRESPAPTPAPKP